jgi:transposase, IS5 family
VRQQTLAAQTGFEKYGRKSKREQFLEEMEQIFPWAELHALKRQYVRCIGRRGGHASSYIF